MIRHIVMWKLKEQAEGASKGENFLKLRDMLEALRGFIPQIVELEVEFQMEASGANYDVVLVSAFQDKDGLARYRNHPEHQKVVAFVQRVTEARAAVDYETN